MNTCARLAASLAAALLVGSGALAEGPRPYRAPTARDRAGVFDYYLLSLSWSPSYCAVASGARDDLQCARRFAFVLHGLWPQFERGWPQDCRSPDRGFVPYRVAVGMRDIMPSDRLVFHTYRKHGTCSGLGVDGYFALARRLFEKIAIPPRFRNLVDERFMISPGELVGEFLASNPDLRSDMIAVACAGSGHRLREVRICFDKGGNFRACGANEDQRRLCSAARMYVPPLRLSNAPGLPGPRDEP